LHAVICSGTVLTNRNVWKTEIWFGIRFQKPNRPKFDTCSDGIPIETACNQPFK